MLAKKLSAGMGVESSSTDDGRESKKHRKKKKKHRKKKWVHGDRGASQRTDHILQPSCIVWRTPASPLPVPSDDSAACPPADRHKQKQGGSEESSGGETEGGASPKKSGGPKRKDEEDLGELLTEEQFQEQLEALRGTLVGATPPPASLPPISPLTSPNKESLRGRAGTLVFRT